MILNNQIVCPLLTGITSLPWLYPLVFGVACLFAGFLILFLPETAGKPMMSTIEEAEMYYKNRAQTVTASIRKRLKIYVKWQNFRRMGIFTIMNFITSLKPSKVDVCQQFLDLSAETKPIYAFKYTLFVNMLEVFFLAKVSFD